MKIRERLREAEKKGLIFEPFKHSEKTKRLISERTKIALSNPIIKEKSREAHRGKKFTEERKKNISKGLSRIWKEDRASEKQKQSLFKKGHDSKRNMNQAYTKETRAKVILPKQDTSIELKMQEMLKQLNIHFITHKRITDIKHNYCCDIFVPSMNLVIECDGNYFHNYPYGTSIDIQRNKELWAKGYHTLRLWENEINFMDLRDLNNIFIKMEMI